MPERLRTKSELKRLFTNLRRKLITDNMMSILIDVLWRDWVQSDWNQDDPYQPDYIKGKPDIGDTHPPITIAPTSTGYLDVDENQVLSFIPEVLNNPDGLRSGGNIIWLSGFSYAVSMAVYYINNTLYISPSTIVTLGAADATYGRIDVIAVNSNSEVVVIPGTPAAEPQKPSIDPATQIELTFVLVPANATEPTGITDGIIYDENTEWTATTSGVTVNFNYATAPYSGVKCASVGAIGINDTITFTAAAPEARDDYETISLFLKLKAVATKSHFLYARFKLGANFVSNEVSVPFNITDITNWQSLALQLTAFAFSNAQFDGLQLRWVKTGTQADHAGFYLDYVKLQTGVVAPVFTDTVELIGDVIGTGKTGTPIPTVLKVVNSNVGTYGTAAKTVTITVDAKGRVTAISENDISPGLNGDDGREIELSTSGGYIVWRYVGDIAWTNLCPIPANGADGTNGTNGTNGSDGAPGADGTDGREVELRENAGWVEWRYVGDVSWTQLYEIPTGGEGGGTTTVVTQGEEIEVYIDFVDNIAYTYTCPFALRFLEIEYENNAPALSVALNTAMSQYDDLVVTPDGPGLVIIKGKVATAFIWDVYIDFEIAEAQTYKCPYAIRFDSLEHEQANAPAISPALGTSLAKYDVVTITPDAVGLVTLLGVKL